MDKQDFKKILISSLDSDTDNSDVVNKLEEKGDENK